MAIIHKIQSKSGEPLMKIWLDDLRPAPKGYIWVHWPNQAIELLKKGECTHLSLDHDLGDDVIGTGYDVLLWIEQSTMLEDFKPPIIYVHSANIAARQKMESAIGKIKRISMSIQN